MSYSKWEPYPKDWKCRWEVTESTRQTSPWHKSKIVYVAPGEAYVTDRTRYPTRWSCHEGEGDRILTEDYLLTQPL